MTSPAIRLGTTSDLTAVLALWARADAVPSVTDDEDSLRRAVEHAALLVACDGDRVVGTVIAAFDGWRGNLYRLAVDPEYQRRGLGLALVAEAERRLVTQGCRRINALVVADEHHATSFWTAAGYDHDKRIARHVKTQQV